MSTFDQTVDAVVVGSGAAGMVTALAAREQGLRPVVVESAHLLGGNSAISGGGLWIPDNHVARQAGSADSYEEARTYLDLCVGDVGPASSPERRHAFLTRGPELVRWLETLGMRWIYARGYADYYPERPGGKAEGRAIEGRKYNLKRLGKWADSLRFSVRALPLYTTEASKLALVRRTWEGFSTAMRVGLEATLPRLLGKQLVGLGNGLMGPLLEMALKREIPLWVDSPMEELLVEGGRVVGVSLRRGGQLVRVGATRGVMLASGGFEKNTAMRQQYQEAPISDAWTSGTDGNTGHPIEAARRVGAALALMEDAWWGPTMLDPVTHAPQFMLWERSLPFGFIVASDGKRFLNESESYVDAGHHQYEKHREVPAIPAWLVMDSRHRQYYPFGSAMPGGSGTRKLVQSGAVLEGRTLEELAGKMGIDPAALLLTAARFNGFARTGQDLDFHRGDSAYDRVYSDPRVAPNPNLGPVDRPPYYAARVYPGDLGTKGGVLTDEFARALREDGSVIEGLYAAGNASASVMGHTYPGPGSTLGPAAVFGYLGGLHLAGRPRA
jgi:3-oxosteroid 1-dehydrogenase